MSPLVVVLALTAAVMHALWNVRLKTSGDPLAVASRASVASAVATAPIVGIAWVLVGRPEFHSWFLCSASAIAELAYFVLLSAAYRRGDISVVYPVARGTAPLLAVGSGVFVLGEKVGGLQMLGVVCLLGGIWCVRRPIAGRNAFILAVLTGFAIATYSTVDAVAVYRDAPWLYGWILSAETAVLLAAWVHERDRRSPDSVEPRVSWGEATAVGAVMTAAYLLILIAFRLAPLALVAPLRESAVVFVAVWGIWRLEESRGQPRSS